MDDHQFNNILPPYGFMDLLKIVASTQLVHAHLIKVTTNDNFNSMVFYSQGVNRLYQLGNELFSIV